MRLPSSGVFLAAFLLGILGAAWVIRSTASTGTAQPIAPVPAPADPFSRDLRVAMARMESAMCITPSGDSDRDFARAMIPHHQGAIEMAQLELLHGHDPRLRRLAQGIVVEQSQEIALMQHLLLDTRGTP
jgi:uncharacterized protein (DUF305 family)